MLFSLIFVGSIAMSCKKTLSEKVHFSYIGFATNPKSKMNHLLFFCIENKSSDTIYLSEKQIRISVKDNASSVREEEALSTVCAFPPPLNDQRFISTVCYDEANVMKQKERMATQFAVNLFMENFSDDNFSKIEKEDIIQLIEINSIVLLPKSKTSFERNFRSEKFERSYKVKAEIADTQEFCYFYDKNNVRVSVFNKPIYR